VWFSYGQHETVSFLMTDLFSIRFVPHIADAINVNVLRV
jgi:hypothetical protein